MRIGGKEYRTIWYENNIVKIIDQTKLPHQFIIKELKTVKDSINAIKTMEVRGAPLIGATAAYGIVLAVQENNNLEFIKKSSEDLIKLLLLVEHQRFHDLDANNQNLLPLKLMHILFQLHELT